MSRGESEFDYVVVGSGAGGGPLAANLALAGHSVLVLEAGQDRSSNDYSRVPTFHAASTEQPDLRWDYFVRHYTDPARQRQDSKWWKDGGGVLYPRAGSLGGCTIHNAMITVYPQNSDFDAIADETGDPTWRASEMRRWFERLERCTYGPGSRFSRFLRMMTLGLAGRASRHGYDGWLTTQTADPTLAIKDKTLLRVVLEAVVSGLRDQPGGLIADAAGTIRGLRAGGLDPNDWRRVSARTGGPAFTPLATDNGERNGPREYMKRVAAMHPERLVILTDALACRVLLDESARAVGVEFLPGAHLYRADPESPLQPTPQPRTVLARREVIVCGGAFNTPQLLMLSGIGPKDELSKHGIDCKVDLPGVGGNLQDRYEVCVVSRMKGDFALLKDATYKAARSDPHFAQWQDSRSGVYTSNGVVLGLVRRSEASRPDPDLFIFGIPGFFRGYFPGYSKAHTEERNHFTWAILKGHTQNRAGYVKLRSADPRDVPDINFRYFDDDPAVPREDWREDLESVVEGVKFVRRMNADPDLQRITERELVPGPEIASDDQIRDFVKREAWGHHASCTCPIGADSDQFAVLDSKFRVRGTRGLRVVDASVFPRIPGLFIVSAIYMISEKATADVLETAREESARGTRREAVAGGRL